MQLTFIIGGRHFAIDSAQPVDCSIALDFHGAQPNAYGVAAAGAEAVRAGATVGDTREGGSCNFEELRLIPHCNGTHTECVGHLSDARISVHETLREAFIPATLASVPVTRALESNEGYLLVKDEADEIITAAALRAALEGSDSAFHRALLIRTLPNSDAKRARDYAAQPAPFLSVECAWLLRDLGVEHLLVDVPSLDRAADDGMLSAHRVYWNLPAGTHHVDPARRSFKTITEFIFVPDTAADGRYLLNLQIPSFVSDAAPSRPLLYAVTELHHA
ncbi:MAG: cyclase family protein [Ignavibacteria bacterium]|nr:cyclase family protein [Ignavibacteria bacterium]